MQALTKVVNIAKGHLVSVGFQPENEISNSYFSREVVSNEQAFDELAKRLSNLARQLTDNSNGLRIATYCDHDNTESADLIVEQYIQGESFEFGGIVYSLNSFLKSIINSNELVNVIQCDIQNSVDNDIANTVHDLAYDHFEPIAQQIARGE